LRRSAAANAQQLKGADVAKQIICECGYTVRGETDDELLANAEEHIRRDHPDMVGKVSREELLASATEA
jgi:predicted small metal-binding protein